MTTPMFAYELPYTERKSLCRILDASEKWEELGGEHMGFDYLYLQCIRKKDSPTDQLLTAWGNQNHTVSELFVLLSKMQHYRAMSVIKNFVHEKYLHLLREGEENMSEIPVPVNKPGRGTDQSVPERNRYQDVSIQAQFPLEPSLSTATNGQTMDKKDLGLNVKNINLNSPSKKNNSTKHVFEIKVENVDQNCNNHVISNGQQAAYNPNFNPKLSSNLKPPNGRKLSSASTASSVMEGCTPLINYVELEKATDGWNTEFILGRGGFGTVYKGTWKNTLVAVKKLESQRTETTQSNEINDNQLDQSLRELKYLNSHRHDNILALYGYSITDRASCLVYQYMANGSLDDRLHCRQKTKPLGWEQRLNIMTGTARGIQFLHSLGEKPLVHGDIKSANILLDNNFEPRIGDFGLAREGPQQQYTHVKVSRVHGTRPYLPDEFIRGKQFSVKVDTYSFGVVLFEVATGLRAYDDSRRDKFLKDHIMAFDEGVLGGLADLKAGLDNCASASGLLMLGRYCVKTRPKDRPNMTAVLSSVQTLYNNYQSTQKSIQLARQQSLPPNSPMDCQIVHDEQRSERKSPEEHDRKSPLGRFLQPSAKKQPNYLPPHSPEAQPVLGLNGELQRIQTGLRDPIVIYHPPSTPPLLPQPDSRKVDIPTLPPQPNKGEYVLPDFASLLTKSNSEASRSDSTEHGQKVVSSQVTDDGTSYSDSMSELDLSPNTSANGLASENKNAKQSVAVGLPQRNNASEQEETGYRLDSQSGYPSRYLPLIPF